MGFFWEYSKFYETYPLISTAVSFVKGSLMARGAGGLFLFAVVDKTE